jgi:hypothetical protein
VRQTFGAAGGKRQPNAALTDFTREPSQVSSEKAATTACLVVLFESRASVDYEMQRPADFPTKGG